eukprot:Gregarina_sp_Poly_1__11505@NODE_995_length_5435_cov_497_780179_g698_i0_p2_GENE_NODE_995_length_5435_cov_497_780179_g698_i0NODE_995_length_5435_cov_497_780179_g698_i0_p2_ORF_typecomplete_len489_score66_99SRP72/PF08492_12/5_5e09SRP72/PF08492_12/4_5e02DUF5645/PF18713_1/2_9e02DUF5645/PF18713_1/2e02DUF5645/PF18713_1/0_66DUF3825/PF12873_7/3e03DUF3825/PF12873_7/0_071_NODE_995_length_5435_cov_497_780179_g698_i01041468
MLEAAIILVDWEKDINKALERCSEEKNRIPDKFLMWLLLIRLNLVIIQLHDQSVATELVNIYGNELKHLYQVGSVLNAPLELRSFLQGSSTHEAVAAWKFAMDSRLNDYQKAAFHQTLLAHKSRRSDSLGTRRRLLSLETGILRQWGHIMDSLSLAQKSELRTTKLICKLFNNVQLASKNPVYIFEFSSLIFRIWEKSLVCLNSSNCLQAVNHIPLQVLITAALHNDTDLTLLREFILLTFFGRKTNVGLLETARMWVAQIHECLANCSTNLQDRFTKEIYSLLRLFSDELDEKEPFVEIATLIKKRDTAQFQSYSEDQSMSLDTEIFMIDAEDLETNCDWRLVASKRLERLKASTIPVSAKTTRSKQPVNRSKIKNWKEDFKPDPERWLPMKQRSYYQPSKKNMGSKKGKAPETSGLGMQGGTVSQAVEVDTAPLKEQRPTQHKKGKKKGKKR